MGEMRNVYNISVRKLEGKRPPGRPRRGWNNIRMVVTVRGWEGVAWIHLAQDRDQ
jgi:hypothetical protein